MFLVLLQPFASLANIPSDYKNFDDCKSNQKSGTSNSFKLAWIEACKRAFHIKGVQWESENYSLVSNTPITKDSASAIINNWRTQGSYDSSQYTLTEKGCAVDVYRQAEIYDNCVIDKLPANANSTLRRSVRKSCKRTACSPGFFDKLKY